MNIRTASFSALVSISLLLLACGGSDKPALGTDDDVPSSTSASTPSSQLSTATVSTPRPATPGASSSASVPGNWKKFASGTVEMSLPSAFDGGSTNGPAFDALLTKMRGSGQAAMANNLNSARSSYALIMVDTADAKRDAIVNVQEATIPAAMTLDAYVDNGVKAVLADKAGYKQQARLKRTIDGKEAIKVVFSLESDNETLAQYFVRDGTKLWAFTYTAATPSFLSGLGTDYETSALNAKLKA